MKKVAIIGAGLGGLVAGNLLVKKGHKVTLYEAQATAGGYTAGFRRKGFYFEAGTLSLESTATLYKALEDIGVRDQFRLVRKQDRLVSPYFDFTFTSTDAFKKAAYDAFPADKAGLNGYFGEIDPLCKALQPFLNRVSLPLFSGLRRVIELIPYFTKGRALVALVKKFGDTTSVDLAARHFARGTPVYRMFSGFGYPKSGVMSLAGMFTFLAEDYWYAADGMQHLADILADKFKERGGDLRLRVPVNKILTRQGRAVGVATEGGSEEFDSVISACDYKRTFTELLDDPALVPGDQMERIKKAAVSEGVFTVFLGLAMSNDELRSHMKNPGVNYDTYDHDVDYENASDADLFAKVGIALHSPSLINPALAPERKSSLMIMTIAPAGWQDGWHHHDREQYLALKESVKDKLIAKAEAVIPGLRSRAEFAEAATPFTYERYTGNTDGATSAWSWDPRKKFYEKGFASLGVVTPVRNLFIGSCWASQIGGIPGAVAAAYVAARKAK